MNMFVELESGIYVNINNIAYIDDYTGKYKKDDDTILIFKYKLVLCGLENKNNEIYATQRDVNFILSNIKGV